jgi:hypothetical protein
MDPMTASYYRSILFHDSQDQRPLPPTLVLIHAWAFKRFQAMGAGSVISKQAALCVAMTWMSATKEGREFTREFTPLGDVFSEQEDSEPVEKNSIDWNSVPADTKVIVLIDDQPTTGEYIGRRSSRLDVRIAGERKSFKRDQVQLAGA